MGLNIRAMFSPISAKKYSFLETEALKGNK